MKSSVFAWLLPVALCGCLDLDPSHYLHDGGTDAGFVRFNVPACVERCTPQAPSCKDPTTQLTSRLRSCDDSTCQFFTVETVCANGCANNRCIADPCAGIFCDEVRIPICLDGNSLRSFTRPGVCSGNQVCTYFTSDISCPNGCVNGACLGAPCLGVMCVTPPASTCNGNILRSFTSVGACGADGCQYSPVETNCAGGCANGACVADPCSGVTCNQPPTARCASATVRTVFPTSGTCTMGSCRYTAGIDPCPPGDVCQLGTCVTPSPTCNATNCLGCCIGDTCVGRDSENDNTCGTGAVRCSACGSSTTCLNGECTRRPGLDGG